MNENILYIGLELDNESSELLKAIAPKLCMDAWGECNYKLLCHHMTIAFHTQLTDELISWVNNNEGKTYEMEITQIGISDKACAIKVITKCPSLNKIKHVTLAVNSSNNGKPVDSNFITDWANVKPMTLNGKVTIYYKH